MAQVGKRARDPVISPAGVFARHPQDQRFRLPIDAWPTGIEAVLRAVELAGDPTVPSQDRIWFRHAGDLPELNPSEALADLGEGEPLRVGETDPRRKTRPQDLVLSDEIFVLQKQTLVDQPSHISQ